jgi:LysR family transcriptional regulator, glycine cleavage system transcriptional activator
VTIRLPSLVALRAFEAVARTGSVRAAADELAISPTVVSRHLQNLQLDLGTSLVEPRGRRLVLTSAGEAFQAKVSRAFDLLRQATRDARPAQRQSLEIWCTPGLANRRLLSRLPELDAQLRDWDILLQPTLAHANFASGEADAEIVYFYDFAPVAELSAELLAPTRVFPVVSPAFRERLPPLLLPGDLLKAPLIHEESTENWERWFEHMGVANLPELRGPRLWHAHLAIEAARLGQGVALANSFLIDEDLAAGRLVEIGSSRGHLGGYYLVVPTKRRRDPEINALRTWLKSVLSSESGNDALGASFGSQ